MKPEAIPMLELTLEHETIRESEERRQNAARRDVVVGFLGR